MNESSPDLVAPARVLNMKDEDIANASPRDQFQCAIVRTVQRQFPDAVRVKANIDHIAWSIGEQRFVYDTPEVAVDAVIKPLDTGNKPEPIILRLTNGYVKPVYHSDPERAVTQRDATRKREQSTNPNYNVGRQHKRIIENG